MFKFDLPAHAVIDVTLPTGAVARLLHLGNGQFVSEVPPIALALLAPGLPPLEQNPAPVPMVWLRDNAKQAYTQPGIIMFDVQGAMQSVAKAEADGDVGAITLMQRLKHAQAEADQLAIVGEALPVQ